MNTKPFDPTKPCQTRDGRKARILCTDASEPYCIVALVEDITIRYTSDGRYWVDTIEDHRNLINIPEKREGWINIYKGGLTSCLFSTKEHADLTAVLNRIACTRIEYTEGEGL